MKQFAIIGLGTVGYYLATNLYEKKHDVLAIDIDTSRVQEIKDKVTQAVVADATDIRALETLGIKQMDAAVVCIGSILSDSILATLNLKDIGVKRVFAKSVSEPHGRILHKVGALQVFFPEKDMANSLAERGELREAIALLRSASQPPKRVREHHLRQWYVLADLYDRAGDTITARNWFGEVASHDADFADVRERLRSLGR